MDDAVEAMARAIYAAGGIGPGQPPFEDEHELAKAYWRAKARAAWALALERLEAMHREDHGPAWLLDEARRTILEGADA